MCLYFMWFSGWSSHRCNDKYYPYHGYKRSVLCCGHSLDQLAQWIVGKFVPTQSGGFVGHVALFGCRLCVRD